MLPCRRKKKQASDNGDTSDDKNETDTVNNKITSSHSNTEDNSNRNTDKGETVDVNCASTLPPRKGNGCNSHTVYQNYDEQWVLVDGLSPKDLCPLGCGGRLYVPTNTHPGVVVRITGQDFMRVKNIIYKHYVAICVVIILKQHYPRKLARKNTTSAFVPYLRCINLNSACLISV